MFRKHEDAPFMGTLRNLSIVGTALAATFVPTSDALAGGSAQNVLVVEMAVNRAYGNFAWIRVSSLPTGSPSCSNNGYWNFTLSLDGLASRELYATLMAAITSGKQVKITGTGLCSEYSAVESLESLGVTG
jgi:hypothetical protein